MANTTTDEWDSTVDQGFAERARLAREKYESESQEMRQVDPDVLQRAQDAMVKIKSDDRWYKQFSLGFVKERGPVREAINYYTLTDKKATDAPEGVIDWGREILKNSPVGGMIDLFAKEKAKYQYGNDFFDLDEKQRRARQTEVDNKDLNEYYGNVVEGSLAESAGQLTAEIADPSSLAAVPRGFLAGVGAMGAIGYADSSIEQLSKEGKIDQETALIAGGISAALGGVLNVAADIFVPHLKRAGINGEPIDEARVAEEVTEAYGEEAGAKAARAAKEVNEDLDIDINKYADKTAKDAKKQIDLLVEEGMPDSRVEMKMAAVKSGDPDKIAQAKTIDDKYKEMGADEPMPSLKEIEEELKKQIKKTQPKKGKKKERKEDPDLLAAHKEASKSEDELMQSVLNSFAKDQGGHISQHMLNNLAGAGIGGAYGYAESGGDLETAALYALGGSAIIAGSTLGYKMSRRASEKADWSKPAEAIANIRHKVAQGYHKLSIIPQSRVRSAGVEGKIYNQLFKQSVAQSRWWGGRPLAEISTLAAREGLMPVMPVTPARIAANKAAEEGRKAVTRLLRGLKPTSPVSKGTVALAKTIRRTLQDRAKLAYKYGVITKDELTTMLSNKNYFPRVYNWAFLQTNAGKKLWREKISGHKYNKAQIESMLKTVSKVGDEYDKQAFKVGIKKSGDKYLIDKNAADTLYKLRGKSLDASMSGHLEKERIIDLPEEVLEPFLLNDPIDVMKEYLNQTGNRIAFAKYFGANNEMLINLRDSMLKKGVSRHVIKEMITTHATETGNSAHSWVLRQYMDQPDWYKNVSGTITSVMSVKLLLSGLANSVQATVNSALYLAGTTGYRDTARVLAKGVLNTIRGTKSQEAIYGSNLGERIAAAHETSMMNLIGELHGESGKFTNAFFKYTGINFVERLQRNLASNYGMVYVEGLLDRKAKLMSKKIPDKKGLKRVNDHLFELGIPDQVGKDNVTIEQLEIAAQRFSNEVNFTSTAIDMPLAMQSPYARIFRQFQSYIIKQSGFLGRTVLEPLGRGNPKPLFALGAAGGVGMAPAELRALIYADDKEYSLTERYLRGFSAMGAFGILYGIGERAQYSRHPIASSLAGPFISDMDRLLHGAASGGPEGALKAVVASQVFPGKKALLKEVGGGSSKGDPFSGDFGDSWGDAFSDDPFK